jgi:hypothetical protein
LLGAVLFLRFQNNIRAERLEGEARISLIIIILSINDLRAI